MDNIHRLLATNESIQLKAGYFRGVDTSDGDLLGHNFELEFTSDTTAKGIWSMTDSHPRRGPLRHGCIVVPSEACHLGDPI
jgi:hypothetical protein